MSRRVGSTLGALAWFCARAAYADGVVNGVVMDRNLHGVPAARLIIYTPQGSPLVELVTGQEGEFQFRPPGPGSYRIQAEASGFAPAESSYSWPSEAPVSIRLEVTPAHDQVSVLATRGLVDDPKSAAQVVSVRSRSDFGGRPLPTLGAALQNTPGVMVQTTTYGHVSPTLRGLTGYQTLILFDGVRFNNAIFRSGPNQYMAFIDPGQAASVEAVLGPASASYGSDALGGVVSVLSPEARYRGEADQWLHGSFGMLAATADASAVSDGSLSLAGRNFWWTIAGSGRRLNDLRAGQGVDSRNVLRRYFGLPQDQTRELLGSRLQDTAFTQAGVQTKVSWRPGERQSLSGLYQRSGLYGLRSYRDQWGGLGRLQAAFDPQAGELAYLRYERMQVGFLDSLTARVSFNRITDGSVRQGLNPADPVTREEGAVSSYGYSVQGSTHARRRQVQVFGAEYYDERVTAQGFQQTPGGASRQVRAPFPNGSKYGTAAVFGQHIAELLNGRLRLVAGGRWTSVRFGTVARDNITAQGVPLGVVDSDDSFGDATFHSSASVRLRTGLTFHALAGRGFRAPNVSDLGGVGLSGLGYEIPASEAVFAQAWLGNSAAENALPAGRRVSRLGAETLWNYELGLGYQSGNFQVRGQAFLADLGSPIVRRTLLFDAANAPSTIAGVPVTALPATAAQRTAGVIAVATPFDSRSVKAIVNDGAARYSGVEALMRYSLRSRWKLEGSYSVLAGRLLNPNRPARRLPPQQGWLSLRYVPTGRRPWLDVSASLSGTQLRLAPEDLDDERIGASRRRSDIAAFFQGGLVAPWIDPSPRGPIFRPTGETLREIQNRVLPLGATINGVAVVNDASRVPLLATNAGYAVVDVRGAHPVSEWVSLQFGVLNIFDRNARSLGSGVDLPGRSMFTGLRLRF
ncbi:MAG: TonB-dependent receptor [Bryobacterales bacterium]|nr:TonB-dependent receptor [Bryobacterales bacterium]